MTYYKEIERKKYSVVFETNHPEFNDLNMTFTYNGIRKNGDVTTDNVVTLGDLEINRFINAKKHFPDWELPEYSESLLTDGKYIVSDLRIIDKNSFTKLKRTKKYCYKGDLAMTIDLTQASHSHYPEDGIYAGDRMTLYRKGAKGLPTKISKDGFRIEGDFAILGHGDSHAEDDGDGKVSYEYVGYITKAQQRELGLSKARYFVVTEVSGETFYTTYNSGHKRLRQERLDKTCRP